MRKSQRPKIEILRLASAEHAKMEPLLCGGVQLRAEFQHHRSGDYASCTSLEDSEQSQYRLEGPGYQLCCPALATKSCDNIFARQVACDPRVARGSPFQYRDATRSAEQLYEVPVTHRNTRCSEKFAVRSRLAALLKKLSPRPRRSTSKGSSFPWVLVEFSPPDLSHAGGRGDSAESDHSFQLAVKESHKRRQQQHSAVVKISEIKPLVAPQIVIASPDHSSSMSQGSAATCSRKQNAGKSSKVSKGHSRPEKSRKQVPMG